MMMKAAIGGMVFLFVFGSLNVPVPEAREVALEKIIVTSKRVSSALGEAAENIAVLSQEEMKYLPTRDVGEVLSYVPGVDVEPRQGLGQGSSVTIQGCDSRQVRFMIDGIPLNNQVSGQADPSKFPLENIDHIEVIRGPSSSVWGSALGGVINVITKDTGTTIIPRVNLAASFAEFQTRTQNGDVSGKAGPLGYYLFSGHMESNGSGPRSEVLKKDTFGKISYDLDPAQKIIASFGYDDVDVDTPLVPVDMWQSQSYQARYGKVSWQNKEGDGEWSVDLKRADQNIVTKIFFSLADEIPGSIVRTKDLLYQLSLDSKMRPRSEDLLVVGGDLEWHRLKSSYLIKAKAVTLGAPYANYTLVADPWDFNAGLRLDYNNEFGNELSPSVGAVYHLEQIPETSVRLGVSRAFNAPPLLWKHYELILSGLTNNPGIKAERAWVYELGMESRPLPAFRSKLSFYYSDVSDALNRARNDDGQYFMKNFEKFRRRGAALQVKIDITEELSFSGAAGFNDTEDMTTKTIVRGGGKPRQSFNLGIDYKNKKGLDLLLCASYDRWNETPEAQPNDRKMLFDLTASRDLKNITLFFVVRNLANSKYWADYFFPVPRRHFEGGVRFKW